MTNTHTQLVSSWTVSVIRDGNMAVDSKRFVEYESPCGKFGCSGYAGHAAFAAQYGFEGNTVPIPQIVIDAACLL
jgi:hypothetical protein